MAGDYLTFDWHYIGQKQGEDFAKFCSLLRIYELVQFVLQYSSVKNIIVNQGPANIHEVSLLKVCLILLNIDSILNRNIRDNFQQEKKKKEKRGKTYRRCLT